MKIKLPHIGILISLVLLVLIISSVSSIYFKSRIQAPPQPSTYPLPEQTIAEGCTRTSRLENDPQYDRALSLIHQRIDDMDKWCDKFCETEDYEKKLRFQQFPANLTNCIKIIEEDIDGDVEGYFTFHSADIKPNYFPITIDDSYYYADDILTALLITHEMTHVQQYLDSLKVTDTLSCRDKEVEAFISQIDLYVLLSNEEINSVLLKINEERDNKHPQVAMLKTMIDINRDGTCPLFTDEECSQKHLRNELFKLITNDATYRHQCQI